MRANSGFRLPTGLDFGVWGLSREFSGDRSIGLWDAEGMGSPLRESADVYRVVTHHEDRMAWLSISVHTVPKRPRNEGHEEHCFENAAGSALLHATWKAAWCEPEIEATLDTRQVLRPGEDADDPAWQRHRLRVDGTDAEGHYLLVGQAWVAVVELPDLVLGVSGCGAAPDDYELAPIADLGEYASQSWPRDRRRGIGNG